MKKNITLILALACALALNAQNVKVLNDGYDNLTVSFQSPELSVSRVVANGESFDVISLDGYVNRGIVGQPSLPVLHSRIEMPVCESFTVSVSNAVYDTIDGSAIGLFRPILPQQPLRIKSDTTKHENVIDEQMYETDAFVGPDLATVRHIGIARDRNLAVLSFSPIRYNPVSNRLTVCRYAEITVTYNAADEKATHELFDRYNSPAFSAGATLNNLISSKEMNLSAPIRMTIVSASAFKGKLTEFVDWKTLTGFIVDTVFLGDNGIGSTENTIAQYLKGLYANATASSPAPTYVLLVGDNTNLPAFSTAMDVNYMYETFGLSSHITDLYYTTWSEGDSLPDCYVGRFSARTLNHLNAILSKTLQYERYAMPDPSYLDNAVLIAGVDEYYRINRNDNGYTYSDPTMDYVAKYYVNAANGFSNVTYYKNDTAFHPAGVVVTGSSRPQSTADSLRAIYNRGAGWVNYSAHGDYDEWSIPSFTTRDVANMTNYGKPMVMIGNCCLSNKFNKTESLSEALLRRGDNAGAALYIGATNSTIWEPDFQWSVGVRSNISGHMDATYNNAKLGMYDRLFHTHNEARSLYCESAGAMVYAGNMSVHSEGPVTYTSGGTSFVFDIPTYYWEIYGIQGDPSLMPWLSQAETMELWFESWLGFGTTSFDVNTEPYAYVGVTDSAMNLVGAAFANEWGVARVNCEPLAAGRYTVTSTAQGFIPRHQALMVSTDGIDDVAGNICRIYPNPAADNFTVEAEGLREVTVINAMGQTVMSHKTATDKMTVDAEKLPAGVYFVRVRTSESASVLRLIVK